VRIKGRAVIARIITGGQTGADQATRHVARAAGIATGGWVPQGRP
jgi:hypothetical protein